MTVPRLSIITACLNRRGDLARTMASVRAQAAPVEHVVVDGGSTDGSVELLRAEGGRLRWISERDRGISDAFNKGLALASGEWLGFLNAGDVFSGPASAECILAAIADADRAEAGVVASFARYGRTTMPKAAVSDVTRLARRAMLCHQATWVHRRVFAAVGGFDESYRIRMDYVFWLRALAFFRLRFVPQVLVDYPPCGLSARHPWRFFAEEWRANRAHHPQPRRSNTEALARFLIRRLLDRP